MHAHHLAFAASLFPAEWSLSGHVQGKYGAMDKYHQTILRMVHKQTSAPRTRRPHSVYINLPFCRRRCYYCDFPIKVVGDRPGAATLAAYPYVDNVLEEMRATSDALGLEGVPEGGLDTVFFGGGTPSLCPPELVASMIEEVRNRFGISSEAEICMEMDPGTFDQSRLEEFLSLGLTRVSMGVQSFDEDLLKSAGRAHSLEDVYRAVELMHKTGFENFSIDLISGLPNQTPLQWEHSLEEAVSTQAAHLSVYDLQVEGGTAFGHWYTAGAAPLPEDDACADMYRTASRILRRAGYDHYEISNYARPGFQSQHNRAYWENQPFLAFGNGAASFINGHRFSRPRGLPEYELWVKQLREKGWGEATGAAAAEQLSGPTEARDNLLDDIMLGFRLSEGLDLAALGRKYGMAAVHKLEAGASEGLRNGWVKYDGATTTGSRSRLRLADPDGFLFSNTIISSIFCELDGFVTVPE